MVIDLIVTKTGDGYNAEVPAQNGCETWAHTEDEVLQKSLELICFYFHVEDIKEVKLDLARKEKNKLIYKVIFNR